MTKAVAERLEDTGITVDPYKRGPLGADAFAISIRDRGRGAIRLWEGKAEVDVRTSRRHNQAVLNVHEPAREISRRVRFSVHVGLNSGFSDNRGPSTANLRSRALDHFDVWIPGARRTVTDIEEGGRGSGFDWAGSDYRHYRATVTATTRESDQTLLCGIDETHHFVAALPESVNSVAEAHDLLRPARVPVDAIRQGEWFFVPVSQREHAVLERRAARGSISSRRALERGSSHRAMQAIELKARDLTSRGGTRFGHTGLYVIGYVIDTRPGRHAPLFLTDWHRVVRNNEIKQSPIQEAMTRYWD